jgi:tetratricopeptide (TPR) repeat protein
MLFAGITSARAQTNDLQSLVAEAQAAQSRRDFSSAADAYRKATQLDPSIAELWANLGLMDHEIGKSSEAIESFKHAIRLKPTLFVPQFFLGLEYLSNQNPGVAIQFLEKAKQLNPKDEQVELALGRAESQLDHGDRAADAYLSAVHLAPNDGNAWLGMGTAYLQQVENDARVMATTYGHSVYVKLRAAESFAEEGKLVQAEEAYEAALAFSPLPPCTHAEFGITLLRESKVAEARQQFAMETQSGTQCGLALLGNAVADVAEGKFDAGLKELGAIASADPYFVQWNLPAFHGALSTDQADKLVALAASEPGDEASSPALSAVIHSSFLSDTSIVVTHFEKEPANLGASPSAPASAEKLYAAGHYKECDQAVFAAVRAGTAAQQELLAQCSYNSGDFLATATAARHLKASPATKVQGLYWETKADQKLAIGALVHAGEIDSDSPRMHVLLGDVYRQKRRWGDAEAEYRKAVALDPRSWGARLSLAIALFTELKDDEALAIDKALLAENPDDPEANLLAGEILVQTHQFSEAEAYLVKCRDLKPEFMPRWHVLMGQVYAQTNRIPEAIAEYKQGLSSDVDGSVHYQLARLYQKNGDRSAAEEEIRISKELRERWDTEAHISLEQLSTDVSKQ